jgi:TP901-1 family phage major tail protein
MAASSGRELLIKKNDVVLAGVRTKTVTINGEPIDVTTDDDSGYRTLLGDPATRSIDLSVEGITKDATLRAIVAGGGSQMLTDITVEYPNGDEISGDFYLVSIEEAGEYQDAVTFTASLQSSGEYTYTPTV